MYENIISPTYPRNQPSHSMGRDFNCMRSIARFADGSVKLLNETFLILMG